MSSFLIGVALMLVGSSTDRAAPEHKASVCEITHHLNRYLGRKVVVDALLVDASPHSIYVADPKDSSCILHLGNMAAGEKGEVFDYLGDSMSEDAKVRIQAILKSEMRDDPWGRGPTLNYILDEMTITRLEP